MKLSVMRNCEAGAHAAKGRQPGPLVMHRQQRTKQADLDDADQV